MNWYKIILAQQTILDDPEYPVTSDKYEYFRMGHDEDDSFCWIFDGRQLYWKKGGTHAQNFPSIIQSGKPFYRGWFNTAKKILSIIVPRGSGWEDAPSKTSLPAKLRVALSDIFGYDNKIMVY